VTSGIGRIVVRGVRAYGRHGADPGEREHLQPLDVDVVLELDMTTARRSDALSDTVDYATLHASVVRVVASTSFSLLERLGDEIAADLMRDARILRATITLAKPGHLAGATAAVTVESSRVAED
jgi:dihydroneopterin aldolase